MGISLDDIDSLVLSHGHYDHSGGLPALMENTSFQGIPLIAHPNVFEEKVGKDGVDIGCPVSRESAGGFFNVELTKEPFEIADDVIFTGEIPTNFEDPLNDGHRYENGKLKPDYLVDEGALVFNTSKGLVVVTGCSHPGIVNVVRYARELFDTPKIFSVVGGFHLINEGAKRVNNVIEEFKALEVSKVFPCHCTGYKAIYRMVKELDAKKINSGEVLELKT